jgi:hypothetical protein
METIINRNDLHLSRLLRPHARLRDKLARAKAVPAQKVPTDVVTMNSKVRYRDDAVDTPRDVKLVYPVHADGSGRLSILSPLGTALLGRSVGQKLRHTFRDWGFGAFASRRSSLSPREKQGSCRSMRSLMER